MKVILLVINLFAAIPIIMADLATVLPIIMTYIMTMVLIMTMILRKGEAGAKGDDQSR